MTEPEEEYNYGQFADTKNILHPYDMKYYQAAAAVELFQSAVFIGLIVPERSGNVLYSRNT
jgi:hypothetical protein